LRQLSEGTTRRRVGIRPDGRAPAREGTALTDPDGNPIGAITSGSFGPTAGGPVAMGYVQTGHADTGTQINAIVRGKPLPAQVADMPFVTQNYYRG
jgi:aminomethyltransferase